MKDKDLEAELEVWFNNCDHFKARFWHKNKIARMIKQNLKEWGHFKEKPRGKSVEKKGKWR